MSSNWFKLNTDNTQLIWSGSRHRLQEVGVNAVHLGANAINFQTTVGNLGVTIDSQMTMTAHVRRICRTSFHQLRQLRTVRRSLSSEACTVLVHAFVTSRLDYCNSLLAGISDSLLLHLQSILRVADCLFMRKGKFDPIPISNDIRDHLHWLPIPQRVQFKLGLLVYKCLHGGAPPYLAEMLVQNSDVPALRSLRSTARGCLVIPRTKTDTIGPRSFATADPTFWNSLPTHLRDDSIQGRSWLFWLGGISVATGG